MPTPLPQRGSARAIQTRRPDVTPPSAISSRRRNSTNNLKRLIELLAPCPAPRLLDVGRLCDQNIEWLIHHRFKVTVDDQITSLLPPPRSTPSPPRPPTTPSKSIAPRPGGKPASKPTPPASVIELHQPAGAFDVILCWDLFDYLEGSGAEQSLPRLADLLKPRGYLLAFFNCERTTARPATRYRIVGPEQLEYEPLPQASPPCRAYENREIVELFDTFDLINSCYLPNQMREILVQKRAVRVPRP